MAAAKLGRLSASYWVAAPAATKPPAEKPSMPSRCGSTPHLRAFCLTVRTACMPSATTIGRTLSIWSRYWCGLVAIRTSAASSSGVGTTRYFSTKAVTPRAVNQRATSVPSLSTIRKWKAPPGHTMTPVPAALAALVWKTVSVGWLTLRTSRLFSQRGRSSSGPMSRQRSASGTCSGHTGTISASVCASWFIVAFPPSTSTCGAAGHQRRQQVVRVRRRVRKAQRRRLHHSVHFAQTAGVLEQVFLPRRNAKDLANQVVPGSGDVFVRHLWIEAVLFVEVDCRDLESSEPAFSSLFDVLWSAIQLTPPRFSLKG